MSRLGHGVFAENLAALIDREVFGGPPAPPAPPAGAVGEEPAGD